MQGSVVYKRDVDFQNLGGGVSRRVLAHEEKMMMVEVRFEADGIGAVHRHPHVQCTYVLSGRFRFTIEGEDVEVTQGDSIAFPGGVPHGTTCLEAGALLDVFTPSRADFL